MNDHATADARGQGMIDESFGELVPQQEGGGCILDGEHGGEVGVYHLPRGDSDAAEGGVGGEDPIGRTDEPVYLCELHAREGGARPA
jgi:hypothetical protein